VATALLVAGSTSTFEYLRLYAPARTQALFKALGCSYNCKQLNLRLVLINAHVTWWPPCSIDELWRSKRRQNIITALTMLPQGLVSTCKHQYTTAIAMMWTESSWTFPESYTAGSCTRAI